MTQDSANQVSTVMAGREVTMTEEDQVDSLDDGMMEGYEAKTGTGEERVELDQVSGTTHTGHIWELEMTLSTLLMAETKEGK